MIDALNAVLVWLALTGIATFVAVYFIMVGRPKGEMANHVVWFMIVLLAASIDKQVHKYLGAYPFDAYVSLATSVSGNVVVWWRVILFVRLQRRGKGDDDPPEVVSGEE